MDHLDRLETSEEYYLKFGKEKKEETFVGFENEDPNVVIALTLSTLKSTHDESVEVTDVKEKGNLVTFKIKAEISDAIEINTEGEIIFVKENNKMGLKLNRINGSLF